MAVFVMAGKYGDTKLGVIRTDAGGNIIWSRRYHKPSYFSTSMYPYDILQIGNDIYVAANAWQQDNGNSPDTTSGLVIKLDYLTCNSMCTKKYTLRGPFQS